MSRSFILTISAILVLGVSRASLAQVVETDSVQQGAAPFTPTYTVPSGNLLQGLTPTVVSPNAAAFQLEGAGGVGALTDGQFGTISGGLASNGTADNSEFATGGSSGGGTSLTYALPSPVTLTSVQTLGGWNDGGRDTQAYTVSYGIGGVFTPLATVNYDPTSTGQPGDPTLATASQVTLDGFSVPLVDSIRFNFGQTAENGYQGYAELEAFGTASTPEPAMMGAMAVAGLLLSRRRARG